MLNGFNRNAKFGHISDISLRTAESLAQMLFEVWLTSAKWNSGGKRPRHREASSFGLVARRRL